MNKPDMHGYARMNLVDDLQTALMNGADVNEKDRFGATPLHYAIAEKHLEAISSLLRHGADVTVRDGDGKTPLHYAVEHNLPAVAEELLRKNRTAIAIADRFGNEPLWTATFNARGSYEFVALLLRYGADPKHQNNSNLTPLDIPKRTGDEALLRILESH
jgi:ankyrin repeat protein